MVNTTNNNKKWPKLETSEEEDKSKQGERWVEERKMRF